MFYVWWYICAGITHELRTPLNGIIGLSDAILSGTSGQCDPQVTKNVTVIKTSGARLLNLINDILDAAAMRQVSLTHTHSCCHPSCMLSSALVHGSQSSLVAA